MKKNRKITLPIVAIVVLAIILSAVAVLILTKNNDRTLESTEQTTTAEFGDMLPRENIIDTASSSDSLTTLVIAVASADLIDTLNDVGPFTVLAPSNAAFEALPEGTLEALLLPENQNQLTNILTYHVIASSIMSTDLENGQVVETFNGTSLTVDITEAGVFFVSTNGERARVIDTDILATNGVIHTIDSVLLP